MRRRDLTGNAQKLGRLAYLLTAVVSVGLLIIAAAGAAADAANSTTAADTAGNVVATLPCLWIAVVVVDAARLRRRSWRRRAVDTKPDPEIHAR